MLHIDLETYSSVDLKTEGAYKYVNSPDFEILLLAYAYGDSPIEVVDLTREKMPRELVKALDDPSVTIAAHNATFERLCLGVYGFDLPPSRFFCSMVKSAYCGLALGLDQVSKALKLGDKGKIAEGKELIRYFCVPCKPTKTNEGRTRNLPTDDPEKWERFKEYVAGDVRAEREVLKELKDYFIPSFERDLYVLDQKINDRGVRVDLTLAENAIKIDEANTKALEREIIKLTGVSNPNSIPQLKAWLEEATGKEITSIAKENLNAIAESSGETVKQVIDLRKRLAKTSIKKYYAMINTAGDDARVRGLFQFYGANRTGRWAGRLVQLQNLARNKVKNLGDVRQDFRDNDYDTIELLYDGVSSMLSQLIRTALVAPEGKLLAVSDFSAIEARVIAWYSREDWRLEVFNTHGKIYEASASRMFGVPIEEIGKGSTYRDKGKIAELALGFGGSVGALQQMGGEAMGLSESEMRSIVKNWRNANPSIVKFWKRLESAAIYCIENRKSAYLENLRGLKFDYDGTYLTIKLPSGRKLFYRDARLAQGRYGKTIKYRGMNQTTKKWTWLDTYGGKLSENIVQATARDLLGMALFRVDREGYPIVMHVHDELVVEVDIETAEQDLENIERLMGMPVAWADELPLGADGYLTPYYKKD